MVGMPLCPQCFNAPEYCECDPRFDPTTAAARTTVGPAAPTAAREASEALLADVATDRREVLSAVLEGFAARGAWIETPPAIVRDYVNVRVPAARYGEARLCAITRSTGRIEFQDDSYLIAEARGVGNRFDHLISGDKAAITPTAADVEVILTVADAVLAARRASG